MFHVRLDITTCKKCLIGASSAIALCFCPTDVAAQSPTTAPDLLQHLPPDYPDDAPPGAAGTVEVRVSIDKQGAVTQAVVLNGPAVFHEEALRAAQRLAFAPATANGQPVSGVKLVHFHFADPHEPDHDHDHDMAAEIIVRAERADGHDSHARAVLDDVELERTAGRTLAESVAVVPGVQLSRTSGSAAKPIVRGYNERRLLVLHDGVRHESQKWGPDHAPEIDPFTAGSITVIKGPAGARYGPDAMGGVLLIEPPPMRSTPGVGGKAMVLGATNGRRAYTALRVDAVTASRPSLSYRVEGSFNDSAALSTPTYVLGNTAAREWSAGGAVEWKQQAVTLRLRYHHFDRQEGIFYGISHATPAELEAQYEARVPASAGLWKVDRTIDRPSQAVTHDRLTLHADAATASGWTWQAIYAYQHNHRLEYAQVRSVEVAGPQYDFTLRTHSLDLHATGPRLALGSRKVDPGVGLQGGFQENVYRGYALIPNHRSFASGAFAHARVMGDHGAVSVASRVDHLVRVAYIQQDDFDRHIARGTMSPSDCPDYENGEACQQNLPTASASVGGLWHAVPDIVDLKLDLSRASRFPNTDELYLIGAAPSLPVFAIGDPGLGVETTWGLSPTAELSTLFVNAELGGFANRVQDYIYFAPGLTASGEPAYNVTINGAWPEYAVRPIDVNFVGADGFIDIAPQEVIGLRTQAAMVRTTQAATGDHLVGTPPDQVSATVYLRPPPPGPVSSWSLGFEVERLGRQSRAPVSADILPPPDGATLLHAETSAELILADRSYRFAVLASNLADTSYREYTSLIRYYADQPGRDIRVRLSTEL